MEKKNFFWWIIFILLCLWQLPQFIISLIMIPFIGKLTLIRDNHYNFCFIGEKMSGGISLGPFAFVSKNLSKSNPSVAHEFEGHTKQSKRSGIFYLLIFGIPSIIHAWLYNPQKHCYYDFYTEKNANKLAKLKTDKNCRLYFEK